MPNESTTKINIDISELKKNIQEANRLIRVANSEFKATSSSMENWAKSADGISAKLTQLNNVVKSQETILDSLEKQYAAVAAEQGENSKGAQELLIKINNQKAAIAKTQSEIKKWKTALDDVSDESKDTVKTTKNLSDTISDQEDELTKLKKKYSDLVLTQGKSSDEAKSTAKEIEKLSSELKSNKSQLSNAEKAADKFDKSLDELDDSAKKVSDGFTVMKGALANLVADGIKNAISGIVNLAGETREYREDMAKLKTGFDEGGFSAKQATDVYKDFYAVLGEEDRSVEAVNHLAKMVDTEEDLATWTDICTGVWGTFGDSLPIEGLTEAANETAKVGKVTGPLADALNWAGVSEDAFNDSLEKCNSEQERSQLIMNTLNGLYSDAADKYRENNKEVMAANEAQSNLTDSYARLGEKAEPIITAIKQGMADLLAAALDLVDGVDFSEVATTIQEGFGDFIENVLPKIKEGFQWIIDNKDILIAGIGGIAAAMVTMNVANMIMNVVKAFKAFKAAQEGATVAQWLLNVAMDANPIGIVIALITGLVTAFVILWNKSEKFRNFWIGLWEVIKEAARVAWEAITGFFSAAWEAIKKLWNGAGKFFSGIWDGIKNVFSNVGSWFSEKFSQAVNKIKSVFSSITGFFRDVWNTIKNIFTNVGTSIADAISGAVKGAVNKVLSFAANTINGFIKAINAAISIINAIPGVNIKKLSTLKVPQLERGGVLKKGQVGLLEGNGAEAVVPLDKNKLWIRKTARDMASELKKQGGVSGNNITQSQPVTQNFYQYNNSPKSLSRLEIYRQTRNQLNFAKGV